MPAKSLQELFVEELRDAYDGEKRLTKALPRMAKAAESDELRNAFTNHLRETERQIQRLEQVFRTIGEPVRGKKCDGLMDIIEEGKTAMEELDGGSVRDAALIAGAQRAEHYEIAAYGTLAYFAELLGNEKAKNLLGQTLDEEKATDEKLSTIAKSKVNRQALMEAGSEGEDYGDEGDEEEGNSEMMMPRSARRGAGRAAGGMRSGSRGNGASGSMANDRGQSGSSTRSRGSSRSSRGSSRSSARSGGRRR